MNNQNYNYPIDPSWSTAEIITVTQMFQLVEDAYEGGASREELLEHYRLFKQIVQSKSEEKQLGRQFEQDSGYQLYEVIKAARQSTKNRIVIKE